MNGISDVNRLAKVSAAKRARPGRWGLKVGQKCVRLVDFSHFYQMFTPMTILWTFGPQRPGPTQLAAEALAGQLTSLDGIE